MQRVMFMMKCKKGKEKEYTYRHKLLMDSYSDQKLNKDVPEEIKELCLDTWALHKKAGIQNYSIFIKNNILYAYMEAEDYKKALKTVTESPIGEKWQAFMEGLLEQENGVPVFEMIECEVFHMD